LANCFKQNSSLTPVPSGGAGEFDYLKIARKQKPNFKNTLTVKLIIGELNANQEQSCSEPREEDTEGIRLCELERQFPP
jgi:hypothetical protein